MRSNFKIFSEQAALASPYLNQKIHEATKNADGTTDKAANLAAHAVLSAIEAQITGNNALAGAAAGVAAEGTAMLIAEKLYEKPIDKLTDSEKQNIVFLSELAGGLAGGIAGDSTADAVAGAETGKRAVENNLLSIKKSNKLFDLAEKLDNKGELIPRELKQAAQLIGEDKYVDYLLIKYQQDPSSLNAVQKEYLDSTIYEIAMDLVKQSNYKLSLSDVKQSLYQWDFDHQIRADYSKLENEIKNHNIKTDNFHQNLSKSTLEAAATLGNLPSGLIRGVSAMENAIFNAIPNAVKAEQAIVNGVNKSIEYTSKANAFAAAHPILTETAIAGTISTSFDIYNNEASPEKIAMNYVLARALAGKSYSQQLSLNTIYNGFVVLNDKNQTTSEQEYNLTNKTISQLGAIGLDKSMSLINIKSVPRIVLSNTASGATEIYFQKNINDKKQGE